MELHHLSSITNRSRLIQLLSSKPGTYSLTLPKPQKVFTEHSVVRYGEVIIYDPSYGEMWPTLNDWETGTLDFIEWIDPNGNPRVRAEIKDFEDTVITPGYNYNAPRKSDREIIYFR